MDQEQEQAASVRPEARWATALAVGVYLVAAFLIAWRLRLRLSPDGVAYLQVAQHYANGNFDLAVNSWWAPMLSWLLVPFIWLKIPATIAVRMMDVFWGLGFAFGVRALSERFTNQRGRFFAFILGLIVGLMLLPRYLTPGVLLTCLMTWYFVLALRLLENDSPALAFKVGLLGGVAYLTKAYSLPFVAAHLLLTMLIKMIGGGRNTFVQYWKQYAFGLLGLLLVATPWIAAISSQDGKWTISSVGKYSCAWSAFPDGNWDERPIRSLQQPREGRISTWENPMEIPFAWPLWSPFDGPDAMKKQLQRVHENLLRLPARMSADEKGLMALGILLVLSQLFPLKASLSTALGKLRLWGGLTALLYVGGYVPILVFDRYLFPIWGMLIVLCVSGPGFDESSSLARKESAADAKHSPPRSLLAKGHLLYLAVLVGALLLSLGNRLRAELRPNGMVDQSAAFKTVAEELNHRAPLAANDWNRGLHVAYWAGSRFIGAVSGKNPEKIARQLISFGRPVLLIFRDKEFMETLAASPLFAPVKLSSRNIWAFELRKLADGQELPANHD